MTLTITPVVGIPEVRAGDDLVEIISLALRAADLTLEDGDILVVASKVASKSLGLSVAAGDRAAVVAQESEWVVAERTGDEAITRVVKAKAGPVMAAAGVDASNTGGEDVLLVLPRDPDEVCRQLHAGLSQAFSMTRLGIILSDTAGRAWRAGQTDFALGAYGLRVTDDLRGSADADGRPLQVTSRAVADELASAADLVKGKAATIPVAHVRGMGDVVIEPVPQMPGGRDLVRTGRTDWFGLGSAESVRAALGVVPGSDLAERIGIPSTGEEAVSTRTARAVATAIHDLPDVGVDIGTDRIVVSAEDPVQRGIAVARTVVALWGEWLEGHIADRGASSVTLTVTPRGPR